MKKSKNKLVAGSKTGMYSSECSSCGRPMVGGGRCFICEFNDFHNLPHVNEVAMPIPPISADNRRSVGEILKDIALTREAIDRIEAELDRMIVEAD